MEFDVFSSYLEAVRRVVEGLRYLQQQGLGALELAVRVAHVDAEPLERAARLVVVGAGVDDRPGEALDGARALLEPYAGDIPREGQLAQGLGCDAGALLEQVELLARAQHLDPSGRHP